MLQHASEQLEKKSISITRLKLVLHVMHGACPVAWKEKHLDYEIETPGWLVVTDALICLLEKKSISITRLKHMKYLAGLSETALGTWKEKHLDYEIETEFNAVDSKNGTGQLEKKSILITRLKRTKRRSGIFFSSTWKEKHLDYEIETRDHKGCVKFLARDY